MSKEKLLASIQGVFLWQKIVLLLWTIVLIRKIYYLYTFTQFVFIQTQDLEENKLVSELIIRVIVEAIHLVIYTMLVRESFNLSAHIQAYIDESSKRNFIIMLNSQQKIWKYLGITFAIGLLMMFYYSLNSYFLE